MTPEQVANKFSADLDKLCKKYGCEVGVWLSWRDLMHNFEIMRSDPNLNELMFGLQIRIPDGDNIKSKKGNEGTA